MGRTVSLSRGGTVRLSNSTEGLSIFLWVGLSIFLWVGLSLCLRAGLSLCLWAELSLCLFVGLSVYWLECLSVYGLDCLFVLPLQYCTYTVNFKVFLPVSCFRNLLNSPYAGWIRICLSTLQVHTSAYVQVCLSIKLNKRKPCV
jgi:hypothetical protein